MKQIQEDHLKQMDEINTMLAEKQKEEVFILICIYKLSVIIQMNWKYNVQIGYRFI
jgi:hypothetical protein